MMNKETKYKKELKVQYRAVRIFEERIGNHFEVKMMTPTDNDYGRYFSKNKSFDTKKEALADLLSDDSWDGNEVVILKSYRVHVDYFNQF